MTKLDIAVQGPGEVKLASDLTSWIKEARVPGAKSVAQQIQPPDSGEMGGTLLAVVGVILGSAAAVELVKVIGRWIEIQHGPVSVTIKTEDGREVSIDAENSESLKHAISAVNDLRDNR